MAKVSVVVLILGLAVTSALDFGPEINEGNELDAQDYQRLNKVRHLSEQFFSYYKNITLDDLVPEGRLPTVSDLQCYADFAQLTAGLASGSLWAYRSKWESVGEWVNRDI